VERKTKTSLGRWGGGKRGEAERLMKATHVFNDNKGNTT